MEDNQPKENTHSISPLDPEAIKDWIATQLVEAEAKKQENEIRIREIDHNKDIAMATISMQSEYLRNRPKEVRKTMTRVAYIFLGFFIIFVSLLLGLLYFGKEDLVRILIHLAAHVATIAIGYYFGRRVVKEKHPDSPSDEIMDN